MDENKNLNNLNGAGGQPPKENPFKNWKFYAAYLITITILAAVSWLLIGGGSDNYWITGLLLLCIPYIISGLIVWAVIRRKNRSIALGILFGSITPFIVVFCVTGGCGLFV